MPSKPRRKKRTKGELVYLLPVPNLPDGSWGIYSFTPDEERRQRDLIRLGEGKGRTELRQEAAAILSVPEGIERLVNRPAEENVTTVWYHGDRSYSVAGQTPIAVSVEQHNMLRAFLDRDHALDTNALKAVGVSNPSSVIKKIEVRLPGAVRRPKKRGDGYFIRVRSQKSS